MPGSGVTAGEEGMASGLIQHIVILGGGSAGWLTAAVLAAEHQATQEAGSNPGLQVTVIEAPNIAPIGVGEGTWPTMRDTLAKIGVSESDFFRECDASFKQGSRFNGWVDGSASDYYFHPFVLPQGYGETNLVAGWQARAPDTPFADLVSFQPHLCVHGKAPKQFTTPEYAGVANYAYHLDAGKFGLFLRKHCVERLGVRHVADEVIAVNAHPNGDIASLQTREYGAIAADLFVDCSGMQSRLLGQHYRVPLVSQKHVLFNDSALALQMPYSQPDSPVASQTTSTAQASGWIWDIGLPTRRGIGYVYSSAHTSDEQAEQALRRYIQHTQSALANGQNNPKNGAQTGAQNGVQNSVQQNQHNQHIPQSPAAIEIPPARKLSFQPGYRQQFWQNNCVAIGLSAGFIEPLEASALALVELSANMLSEQMPATRDTMEIVARRFNEAFEYRWQRVIDFLKLHYVLSRRTDSAYWLDNRAPASIPARLTELLTLWQHTPPSRHDLVRIEEIFPSASYQYVLYGMGFRTETGNMPQRAGQMAQAEAYFREAASLTGKMLPALPGNRELLSHIARHGMPRI
jgi:glycine/D-amino acid oxidase-like deaminating enzyme